MNLFIREYQWESANYDCSKHRLKYKLKVEVTFLGFTLKNVKFQFKLAN